MAPILSKQQVALLALLFGILGFVALGQYAAQRISTAVEDRAVPANPTAQEAYEYGTLYFDARTPARYDIVRAEELFKRALALDSRLPYVNHQLARIQFLRSNFPAAILFINKELEVNPMPSPSSYYVRGLILGYMGKYDLAAEDYRRYLESDPNNWAAVNDYAWVLLKAGHAREALAVVEAMLPLAPSNPWLLNSGAIAAFEVGEQGTARMYIERAAKGVQTLTEKE